MNHISIDDPKHVMSPSYIIKENRIDSISCSFYCGRAATTEHNKEACCEQCRWEIIQSEIQQAEYSI